MDVPGVVPKIQDQPIVQGLDIGIGKSLFVPFQDQAGPPGEDIGQFGAAIDPPEPIFPGIGGTPSEFQGELQGMGLQFAPLEFGFIPEGILDPGWGFDGRHIGIKGIHPIAQADAQTEIARRIQGNVLDQAQL